MKIQKSNVVVVGGFGTVGSLMARVLKDKGAHVTVSDISTNSPMAEILKEEDIDLELGEHSEDVLKSADTVVVAPSLLENKDLMEKIEKTVDVDIISVDEVLAFCNVNKPVVGITGTNGKTSTSWMLKNILNYAGYKVPEHGLDIQGNTELVPSLQARLDGNIAVLEIGTFGNPNEIRNCALNSGVTIGIITNVSKDHLGESREFQDYIKCKSEMVEAADLIILNADDPLLTGFIFEKKHDNVIFYGIENVNQERDPYPEGRNCPVCGAELKYSIHYLGHLGIYKCSCGFKRPRVHIKAYDVQKDSFKLDTGSDIAKIKLKRGGIHNVYNALAAASGALILKVDLEDIVKGIENFEGVEGRFEELDMDKKVIVDFAHNPSGVKAVIHTIMMEKPSNSKLLVVNTISSESGIQGDMEIAQVLKDADVIIVASNAARKAVLKLNIDAYITETSKKNSRKGTLGASMVQIEEALKIALDMAEEDDIILIIGEGGVRYSAGVLKRFKD